MRVALVGRGLLKAREHGDSNGGKVGFATDYMVGNEVEEAALRDRFGMVRQYEIGNQSVHAIIGWKHPAETDRPVACAFGGENWEFDALLARPTESHRETFRSSGHFAFGPIVRGDAGSPKQLVKAVDSQA